MNIFIGSGLLSMPYALAQCGWLGLPMLAIVTGVFCLSGKLIIRAFASLPSGVPHAYPELGAHHACPQWFWQHLRWWLAIPH